MKEFEIKPQLNAKEHVPHKFGAGLTGSFNPSTLDVRGNIFMPEPGGGENTSLRPDPNQRANQEPPIGRDIPTVQSPASPDEIQRMWEMHFGMPLSSMPADQRETVGMAIADKIPPIVAGGAEKLPIIDYNADPKLRDLVEVLNRAILDGGGTLEPRFIQHYLNELSELRRQGIFTTDEARQQAVNLETQLNSWMVESIGAGEKQERFGFYLQSEDLAILKENPIQWLDNQFNTLYNLAQEGQELTSPVINNMQTVVSEAIRYVQYNKPELLDEFQRLFTIRFNLIQMRTTIGYKGIQSIQESAYRLQVHGLLYGLSLEEGRVGKMFNRLNESLEDKRLNSEEFHVTPELINKLQDDLIKEQSELKDKGGIFAGKDETDIKRAVRTAFDILVSSQRMAVIVARGKHLKGLDAYFADPASGPLNVYNIEELLTEKFGIFNVQEQELLRQMKLDMADYHLKKNKTGIHSMSEKDREDLGKRLFRDLFVVPDFFSSGWRAKGVLDALEERLGEEKAKEFALFMRLKNTDVKTPEDRKKREDPWKKIAKYRPEEIIRLFRERDQGRLGELNNELLKLDTLLEHEEGTTVYDKFKHKYGKALNALREQGFEKKDDLGQDMPEQIDMAKLSDDQKELVNKIMNDSEAGNNVVKIFTKMQEYIDKEHMIDALMYDPKFEDIYTRTLVVDDALLNKLELDTWNGKSVAPLSKRYGADQGGDALVRIWNDTANGIKGAQSLIGFIKTENGERRAEHALAFGDAVSQYNGEQNRAKIVRFTMGTFLNLSKQDFMWDALGVAKLPFRRAMSKIEKIYGPQAQPMSRDELRIQLDQLHSVLVYHANDEKDMKAANEFYKDLEGLLEVTAFDATKRRAVSLLFYLILAALIETYEITGAKEAIGKK